MLSFKRPMLLLVAATAGLAVGQPALTTIQDILYRADGTRFTGTIFIRWNSFQAGDTSNIATANLTLPIVNGVLSVKLVPTTTATPGAQYNITYNSGGVIQFTEIWAVPPSTLTLRVRNVRISSGTVVGPPPVISPIQIGDVVGLSNALAVRPTEGVGFAIGRAAIISQAGQIEGAAGNLGDCVRVDGSASQCGGGSGGGVLPSFSDGETPAGVINGANTAFTLHFAPSPGASLVLIRNGLVMKQGVDYSLSGVAITFVPGSVPQSGDGLLASYRYADPANPLGSLTSPQVVCSSVGASTSATTLTELGSCTIPAGLLGTGDRIEVQFQYAHTGTAAGFTGEVHFGATTVITRTGAAGEAAFAGRLNFGIYAGGQAWDSQSWGNSLPLASAVGTAGENTGVSLAISLRAQMSGATADTVTLRNFSVIRYPAQINP